MQSSFARTRGRQAQVKCVRSLDWANERCCSRRENCSAERRHMERACPNEPCGSIRELGWRMGFARMGRVPRDADVSSPAWVDGGPDRANAPRRDRDVSPVDDTDGTDAPLAKMGAPPSQGNFRARPACPKAGGDHASPRATGERGSPSAWGYPRQPLGTPERTTRPALPAEASDLSYRKASNYRRAKNRSEPRIRRGVRPQGSEAPMLRARPCIGSAANYKRIILMRI